MGKVILVLSFIAVASGVDLEAEFKAQSPFCAPLIPAANVNVSWIKNTAVWYVPYMTKSDMIQFTTFFLNESDPARTSLDRAASDACFAVNWDSGDFFGFGKRLGIKNQLYFNPIRPGVLDWVSDGTYATTTYFVLTDNVSYVVGIDVFPDGTHGAFVLTTEPDINKYSHKQVFEWIQKLLEAGFKYTDIMHLPTKCAEEFWESSKF